MSYTPATDFLALLRNTTKGEQILSIPGLDFVVAAMARAGLFQVSVGQSPPTANQNSTVWVQPANPSWSAEATVLLWNGTAYVPATPALWASLLSSNSQILQDITAPGPANILATANIVRVRQTIGAPITLNMPLAANKVGGVLISDWKGDAGTNNITINLQGSDQFPGGLTSWTIAANTGSLFLRPITGGYVL